MAATNKSSTELAMLDEPVAGRLNIQYAPHADTEIVENPPRFSWLPVIEAEALYAVRVTKSSDNSEQLYAPLPLNFFTPDKALSEGDYQWSYCVCDEQGRAQTTWSKIRTFSVGSNLTQTPLPGRDQRYQQAEMAHPRLWLSPKLISTFQDQLGKDKSHCTWNDFYSKSVAPWMDREIIAEPAGYPNHQRVAPVWRQTYIDCQEVLYAIRHLAVAGTISKDQALLDRAKQWLLSTAQWNPAGTTSRSYTDEWAFRINLALAWGYDWLYDCLLYTSPSPRDRG